MRTFQEKNSDSKKKKAKPNVVQPKLEIGRPGDKYEREADAVADRVIANEKLDSSPMVQARQDEDNRLSPAPLVQMTPQQQADSENDFATSERFESRLNTSKWGGQPLPNTLQQEMGDGIGADFSEVSIHTGDSAVQMSRELGAQAFTHGNDIYFNDGKYQPETIEGKRLLAHELTHTVQQGGVKKKIQRQNEGDKEGGIKGTEPDIEAVEYQSAIKTIQGEIFVYDDDSWFTFGDDILGRVNYTIRLGKATWTRNGKQQGVWIVDSADVIIGESGGAYKVYPKIEVRPSIVDGRLETIILCSMSIAGPKVTETVSVSGSAGISKEVGLEIGKESAKASASTSKSLGVSFSCGRTTELPGAELGLRKGLQLRNLNKSVLGFSAALMRRTSEDYDPPENVNFPGGGGGWLFEGAEDIVVEMTGELWDLIPLK